MPSSIASIEARFNRALILVNGCLLWTKAVNASGYGWFKWDTDTAVLAHRAAWLLAGHTLTEGMDLHHLCFNTWCVNVDHLVEVTPAQNRSREFKPGFAGMCGAGLHPWVPDNWYLRLEGPICKPCHLARQRAYDRKVA